MSTETIINPFNKGDKIEVLRNANSGNSPAWFPATIIDTPSPTGTLHVKFSTLFVEREGKDGKRKRKKVRDYVNVSDGVTRRPIPPVEPPEDVVVDNRNVRVCNRKQNVANPEKLVLQSKSGTKLRIICSTRDSKAATNNQKGDRVEVRSYEEGYHGARYVGTVVGSIGEYNVLVQYDTLETDDQMQQLVEMVNVSDIRPLPPIISTREHQFNMLEEVDAWCHDGWWVGVVSKLVAKSKYAVYFWTTNEELELHHNNLRPHQEYLTNEKKWVASFMRPKLAENPSLEKMKLQTSGRTSSMVSFLCGLKVEIAHGTGSYLTTWYPAVILGPAVRNSKYYLVEYPTLKSENSLKLVKEEVHVLCIRPSAPIIQRAHQFELKDAVDAWDGSAWQIGQICTVMKDFKYEVYFWATGRVVEFEHAYLRPHQDFIDGAWVGNYKKQE